MKKNLEIFDVSDWKTNFSKELQQKAVDALENGKVLYFPNLNFSLNNDEKKFLSEQILNKSSKNISYNSRNNALNGSNFEGQEVLSLKEMIKRYFENTDYFLKQLIPSYEKCLAPGKTSFRPAEVKGRKTSCRKDDTLLHVDSFPSNPTQGKRILRMFTNVNPEGKPRVWRVGEPLEQVMKNFISKTSKPIWGISTVLKAFGITKDYRTAYDHYMLQIHDKMKEDSQYQQTVSYEEIEFPPKSSWIVYTDQVSHAAMSGQHLFEQTFYMPVQGLENPRTSPLKVLERLLNKALV